MKKDKLLSQFKDALALLKARNMITHVYNEATAMDIYKEIHRRHDVFQKLIKELAKL